MNLPLLTRAALDSNRLKVILPEEQLPSSDLRSCRRGWLDFLEGLSRWSPIGRSSADGNLLPAVIVINKDI